MQTIYLGTLKLYDMKTTYVEHTIILKFQCSMLFDKT